MRYLYQVIIVGFGVSMVSNLVQGVAYEIRIITLVAGMAALVMAGALSLYRHGVRRERPGEAQEDERTKTVFDKSARNAFIIAWVTLFGVVGFGTLDAGRILIVVVSSLAVFGISYYVYLFKGT